MRNLPLFPFNFRYLSKMRSIVRLPRLCIDPSNVNSRAERRRCLDHIYAKRRLGICQATRQQVKPVLEQRSIEGGLQLDQLVSYASVWIESGV